VVIQKGIRLYFPTVVEGENAEKQILVIFNAKKT